LLALLLYMCPAAPPGSPAPQLVARKVQQYNVPHLVVDPVMVSTSGHSLAAGEVVMALKQHLIPLATIITPNLVEAAALLGEQGRGWYA
jgi:hydroxymethylpyrimidine/phosphomethylpyrimidine kinase